MPLKFSSIKSSFLEAYETQSFVIRQKAYVLFWVQLILILVFAVLIGINLIRPSFPDRYQMIGLDLVLMGAMTTGLYHLKKGAYAFVINIHICVITLVIITGYILKLPTMQSNGYNPFALTMIVTIVYTALFGSRNVLSLITILFFSLNLFGYYSVTQSIPGALILHVQTGVLFAGLGMIIVFSLSFYISKITDIALKITQKELVKNLELNRTLEDKVNQRTAELRNETFEKQKLIKDLQTSLNEVNTLTGLLPICASCKKIRDDSGYWNQIESYISTHSDAKFSHGICPECVDTLYHDLVTKEEKT